MRTSTEIAAHGRSKIYRRGRRAKLKHKAHRQEWPWHGRQLVDSKDRKRRSSSHCCWAFSLDLRKAAQLAVGFSAPRNSAEQAAAPRVNTSCSRQRLGPGRKLCSRLVRTICFRSAYVSA